MEGREERKFSQAELESVGPLGFLILKKSDQPANPIVRKLENLQGLASYKRFKQTNLTNQGAASSFYYRTVKLDVVSLRADNTTDENTKSLLAADQNGEFTVVLGTLSANEFASYVSADGIDGVDGFKLFNVPNQTLADLAQQLKIDNLIPKKPPFRTSFANPSTWVTAALVLFGVTALLGGAAPGLLAGVGAILMGVASAALVVSVPLLVGFSAWLIARDFKAWKIEKLHTHNYEKPLGNSLGTASSVYSHVTYYSMAMMFSPKATFGDYLTALPKRLLDWASAHRKQAVAVGLGIALSVAILFVLVLGSGLGPVAAVTGFLGNVLATAFTGLGAGVPLLAGITTALAQAAGLIASVVLVLTPLVVTDNVRRIASTMEEHTVEKHTKKPQTYQLENLDSDPDKQTEFTGNDKGNSQAQVNSFTASPVGAAPSVSTGNTSVPSVDNPKGSSMKCS